LILDRIFIFFASAAKKSTAPQQKSWIASLRSQRRSMGG
jgi:hypothetical protein